MKIYSWNVNGIRAVIKKGTFQQFITEHQPDILCLQETKAMQGQAEIDLPEYTEYWHSAEKRGYSGTAIFTKLPALSVSYGFPETISQNYEFKDIYGDTTKEGRVTTAEYDDFFLVTVYTPNSKGDLSRLAMRHKVWDMAFYEYVKQLEKRKPVIFCGDLNVAHTEQDLANPKANEGEHGFTIEEREGFQRFIDGGFIDTFREFHEGNGHYSWWTHWANARARNIGWRIDYFLMSESLRPRLSEAHIHPNVMGSDHCPVSITLV